MEGTKRVIALGFFDGVHIGHSALMERVLRIAKERGLTPSVLTFDAHPMSMVTGKAIPLINSPEDRAGLIRRIFGIEDVIFIHFDELTMQMPWDEFVDHLVREWDAMHLVVGHDFRFGYRGEGTPEKLTAKCAELGLGCDVIPAVIYDGVISSSTYIRRLISEGAMEKANEYLGHPHVLTDMVRSGHRLGRTLGTPTINMIFAPGVLIPAFGVYATRVVLENGAVYAGVTNVGTRPTVADTASVTAETYILDYSGNLYGHQVRIEFLKHMRGEIKFSDVDHLKDQINRDADGVRAYFREKELVTAK
ncbi:MAG: riboflavin biosynthesis protein RibF [Oscillospiraceae bacterium]|nr:riboflavin biosynthesis protein RibF [Oscillospiraceae bacterium]